MLPPSAPDRQRPPVTAGLLGRRRQCRTPGLAEGEGFGVGGQVAGKAGPSAVRVVNGRVLRPETPGRPPRTAAALRAAFVSCGPSTHGRTVPQNPSRPALGHGTAPRPGCRPPICLRVCGVPEAARQRVRGPPAHAPRACTGPGPSRPPSRGGTPPNSRSSLDGRHAARGHTEGRLPLSSGPWNGGVPQRVRRLTPVRDASGGGPLTARTSRLAGAAAEGTDAAQGSFAPAVTDLLWAPPANAPYPPNP